MQRTWLEYQWSILYHVFVCLFRVMHQRKQEVEIYRKEERNGR